MFRSYSKICFVQTWGTFKIRIFEYNECPVDTETLFNYSENLFLEIHKFDDNFDSSHIENKLHKLHIFESTEINKLKTRRLFIIEWPNIDMNDSPLLNLFS